jgi:hypothetical protein
MKKILACLVLFGLVAGVSADVGWNNSYVYVWPGADPDIWFDLNGSDQGQNFHGADLGTYAELRFAFPQRPVERLGQRRRLLHRYLLLAVLSRVRDRGRPAHMEQLAVRLDFQHRRRQLAGLHAGREHSRRPVRRQL